MQTLKAILFLSRPLNLLFMVFTMILVRYCIVLPAFGEVTVLPALSQFWFYMLVLSVVLISAAGYLINDYFDVKADEINKPNKIIVGRLIERRWVMFYQIMMNIAGLMLGIACAKAVYRPHLVIYHIFAICLLWYYSAYFKKQLLVGNIIIALLTGLVCWIVVAFEWYALAVGSFGVEVSNSMLMYGLLYSSFAFLVNLIREIVKDAEDMIGDTAIRANTIPIKYGLKTTCNIIIVLCVFTTCIIGFFMYFHFDMINQMILIWTLLIPITVFSVLIFKIWQADTKSDYHRLSSQLKLVMLFGILSMLFL